MTYGATNAWGSSYSHVNPSSVIDPAAHRCAILGVAVALPTCVPCTLYPYYM